MALIQFDYNSIKFQKQDALIMEFADLMRSEISKSNRSLNKMENLTGITRKALGKIRDGKGDLSAISSIKRQNLFNFFFSEKELNEKYSHFKVLFHIQKTQEDYTWDAELSNNQQFTSRFENEMQNPIAQGIYTMSIGNGVSLQELENHYGKYGTKIANQLCEAGLLIFAKDRYISLNMDYVNFNNRDMLKKLSTTASQNYRPENSRQGINFISLRFCKVNSNALRKINDLHSEFSRKLQEILGQNSAVGDIPIYTLHQMDIFGDKKPS